MINATVFFARKEHRLQEAIRMALIKPFDSTFWVSPSSFTEYSVQYRYIAGQFLQPPSVYSIPCGGKPGEHDQVRGCETQNSWHVT